MTYNWVLNDVHHNFLDRLKLAWFFINKKNRWSMSSRVKEFEDNFAEYLGVKYVVATSSGSGANTILIQRQKDKTIKEFDKGKNQIIINGITWSTNPGPAIREGFQPIFLDININDFSLDYDLLDKYLKINKNKVNCIFVTSLIGYAPNMMILMEMSKKYKVDLLLDACESSMSRYYNKKTLSWENIGKNVNHSHSFYIGHLFSGIEMGCIGTNDEIEYQEYILYRNHGMIRTLKNLNVKNSIYEDIKNPLVDDNFSFARIGNNYRPIEPTAYICNLDLKRADFYKKERQRLFDLFYCKLDRDKFYLPYEHNAYVDNVHFCLPVIVNPKYKFNKYYLLQKCEKHCDQNRIERRKIISQTMTRQFPYKKYGYYKDLVNCEYLSNFAFYVGLHPKVKEHQIINLVDKLNKI